MLDCKNDKKLMEKTFYIGGFEGEFSGYTYGDTLNNWECPCFTKSVSQEVIAALKKTDEHHFAIYDEQNHRFIIIFSNDMPDGREDDLLDINKLIKMSDSDLQQVYCAEIYNKDTVNYEGKEIEVFWIGARGWTWKYNN